MQTRSGRQDRQGPVSDPVHYFIKVGTGPHPLVALLHIPLIRYAARRDDRLDRPSHSMLDEQHRRACRRSLLEWSVRMTT
jgi:hypothetical protein